MTADTTAADAATGAAPAAAAPTKQRVVYLFGAGATQACVQHGGGRHGILMKHLARDLLDAVKSALEPSSPELIDLVNSLASDNSDIEHIITFLDESVSERHRGLAATLKKTFEDVLKRRLAEISEANGGMPPVRLYEALLDMHDTPDCAETIAGVLTLNYDGYLEVALGRTGWTPDFGIRVSPASASPSTRSLEVIKLHGSFGWERRWPVDAVSIAEFPLWIPPGVQKAKSQYPFNVLWGRARELLDCDVLRIVGCRLGPNDWDLVSLLFTTRHTHASRRMYRIEIIDSPEVAHQIGSAFPYLDVNSILELPEIGEQIIGEWLGGAPRPFTALDEVERRRITDETEKRRSENWLRTWLKQKAEQLTADSKSITTAHKFFESLLEEP